MTHGWPNEVAALLAGAGWRPGRTVAVPADVPIEHAAHGILAEFGGLSVGHVGAGEECATSDVSFEFRPGGDVQEWSTRVKGVLVGVAVSHHAHAELYVDTGGRCFLVSPIDGSFAFIGASIREALVRLLLGRRANPILRRGQDAVTFYGRRYAVGDPELYRLE